MLLISDSTSELIELQTIDYYGIYKLKKKRKRNRHFNEASAMVYLPSIEPCLSQYCIDKLCMVNDIGCICL